MLNGVQGLGEVAGDALVVDIDQAITMATTYQAAILIVIQTVLGSFMVWMYGRGPAIRHGWPLVVIIAAIQGLGQIAAVAVNLALAAS